MGHIDLLSKFSYIEVPERDAVKVMKALNGVRYKGREVRCNDADEGGLKGRAKPAPRAREERRVRREEAPRTNKKYDWLQFLNPDGMKLKGEKPDFSEEGWARRRPKKK